MLSPWVGSIVSGWEHRAGGTSGSQHCGPFLGDVSDWLLFPSLPPACGGCSYPMRDVGALSASLLLPLLGVVCTPLNRESLAGGFRAGSVQSVLQAGGWGARCSGRLISCTARGPADPNLTPVCPRAGLMLPLGLPLSLRFVSLGEGG